MNRQMTEHQRRLKTGLPQCRALTNWMRGPAVRCGRTAKPGADLCWQHKGKSGVRLVPLEG